MPYNQEFIYFLSLSEFSPHFALDEMTGRLNLTSPTSSLQSEEFELTVGARDKGSPQRTTTANVVVKLTDIAGEILPKF